MTFVEQDEVTKEKMLDVVVAVVMIGGRATEGEKMGEATSALVKVALEELVLIAPFGKSGWALTLTALLSGSAEKITDVRVSLSALPVGASRTGNDKAG